MTDGGWCITGTLSLGRNNWGVCSMGDFSGDPQWANLQRHTVKADLIIPLDAFLPFLPYCCSPTSKSHICTKISVSMSASVRIQIKSISNQVSQSDSLFWDFCNWNNESLYGMVSSRELGLWFLDFSPFLKISPALESYYSLLYLH